MAQAEDKSLSDAARTPIDEHIESRKQDKAFKERHERERELYERLAK